MSYILHLISRITSKRGSFREVGFREDLLLRVFDAFFISTGNYTVPYMSELGQRRRNLLRSSGPGSR